MADKIVILDETDKVDIEGQIAEHASNKNNPHSVTLAQFGVTTTATELNYVCGVTSTIQTQLDDKVPTSRTVNGKTLSDNVSLNANDIGISNRNMLDNWYFVNPVNQRAMTQYTDEGIVIDRWKFKTWSSVNPILEVKENSCIALKNDTAVGTPCSCCIEQQFENPSIFAGNTVTISVKLKGCMVGGASGSVRMFILADNTIYGSLNIEPHLEYTILSATCTLPTSISTMSVVIGADANYGGNGNMHIEIESVKLELGNVSTLAYDAIPNFALELAKCQRYYQKISNIYAYGHTSKDVAYVAVPLTATMRKLPEYVCHSTGGLYVDGNIYYPTNVYPSSIVNNTVILGVTVVGVAENKMAILCDANLDLFADF